MRCVAFCDMCICDSALHDQLASPDRCAQLTRCFSAVAEILVSFGKEGRKSVSNS